MSAHARTRTQSREGLPDVSVAELKAAWQVPHYQKQPRPSQDRPGGDRATASPEGPVRPRAGTPLLP